MTIDEAIEVLTDFRKQESRLLGNEFNQAMELGIEALKEYKEARMGKWYPPGHKLPGETDE
jgi:hypothetical protein